MQFGNCCSGGASAAADALTGFAVFFARPGDARALEQELRPLVDASRAEPGSVSYNMYRDPSQPGRVGFVERWADKAALTAHMAGDAVRSVFAHPYYLNMKSDDPLLYGPWQAADEPAADDDGSLELVFYWTMDCPKQHVWDIITKWDDASWVMGSPKTELRDVDKSVCAYGQVQRRVFSETFHIDVCLVSKDDESFVTVQETVGGLRFPNVTYDTFFVTLSLDSDGLDASTQSRMRYHTRATVASGTRADARAALKNDFYGPRIAFYQRLFNCTTGLYRARVAAAAAELPAALEASVASVASRDALAERFASDAALDAYLARTPIVDGAVAVRVSSPVERVVLPDRRVVAVEDVLSSSALESTLASRIVLYAYDEHGRIESTRVFDQRAADAPSAATKAMDHYFAVLATRDIDAVRALFAADATLEDPTGFMPPRSFDSVYNAFYSVASEFTYTRSPRRTYVDGSTVVQLVDADFTLAGNGARLRATPVQLFEFDDAGKITKFQAFFTPKTIDFSKLP